MLLKLKNWTVHSHSGERILLKLETGQKGNCVLEEDEEKK
jgi:hypothetical protein